MSDHHGGSAVADPVEELFHFHALDVTGVHRAHVSDVRSDVPAAAVAKAVAARMSLPDAPYSLHDGQGAILRDDQPIAEQIKPGESVTVVPKAHLG